MFSKKLLTEVLTDINIINHTIKNDNIRINQMFHKKSPMNDELGLTNKSYGCEKSINIHVIANLCKEYFAKDLFFIISGFDITGESTCRAKVKYNHGFNDSPYFYGENEPEAISKACDWVMEQYYV